MVCFFCTYFRHKIEPLIRTVYELYFGTQKIESYLRLPQIVEGGCLGHTIRNILLSGGRASIKAVVWRSSFIRIRSEDNET